MTERRLPRRFTHARDHAAPAHGPTLPGLQERPGADPAPQERDIVATSSSTRGSELHVRDPVATSLVAPNEPQERDLVATPNRDAWTESALRAHEGGRLTVAELRALAPCTLLIDSEHLGPHAWTTHRAPPDLRTWPLTLYGDELERVVTALLAGAIDSLGYAEVVRRERATPSVIELGPVDAVTIDGVLYRARSIAAALHRAGARVTDATLEPPAITRERP